MKEVTTSSTAVSTTAKTTKRSRPAKKVSVPTVDRRSGQLKVTPRPVVAGPRGDAPEGPGAAPRAAPQDQQVRTHLVRLRDGLRGAGSVRAGPEECRVCVVSLRAGFDDPAAATARCSTSL